MKPLPLLFMGSPHIAVTLLGDLLRAGHEIRGVITQPDKPAGRGQNLHPPPVKEFAIAQGLTVFQPSRLKDPDLFENLKRLSPQAIIVAAYGKLIPNEMLAMTPWGCLNLHFSLLPKYRGASCVASAIRNGESHTGVTIMRIIEKLDAGPILLQEKVEIEPEETTGALEERLAKIGSELMQKALEKLDQGDLAEREQDESLVSFAPLIHKDEGHIDWKLPAQKNHDLIRAFQPWPAAFTYLDKRRIKVHGSKIVPPPSENRNQKAGPGEVIKLSESGIEVACGSGQLLLTEVQPENKRRMKAWDFIQGHHHLLQVGKSFEPAQ